MRALILVACPCAMFLAIGCCRAPEPPTPAPLPQVPASGSFEDAEIFAAQVDGLLEHMTASSGNVETEGATHAWSAWKQRDLLHVREDSSRANDPNPPITCQTQAWFEKGTLRYWKERCEGPVYTPGVRQQAQTQVTFDAEGHAISKRLLVDGQPGELGDLALQDVLSHAQSLHARATRPER